jgi:chromosome segregation ATPase
LSINFFCSLLESIQEQQIKNDKYKKRIRNLEELYKESLQRINQLEKRNMEATIKENVREDQRLAKHQAIIKSQRCSPIIQKPIVEKSAPVISESQNSSHLQHIEQLQRSHLDLERKIEELQQKLQESLEQNRILSNKLEENNNYINTVNNEMQNHSIQLENIWSENNTLKNTITRLNNKILRLEAKKKILKKELAYKEAELAKRNRFISNIVQPTLSQVLTTNGQTTASTISSSDG